LHEDNIFFLILHRIADNAVLTFWKKKH